MKIIENQRANNMAKNMIHKSFPITVTKVDREQGIIDAIVSVMGNIDHGNDIIHNGAFAKTISERASKIKVLDNHRVESTTDVIGKPISIREIGKTELPSKILTDFPDATGGLFTSTQFDMQDDNSKTIFNKLANGFINEWSIGFQIPRGKSDRATVVTDDGEIVVRNIREIMLFEFSPVIFGMNSATTTIGAKTLAESETIEQYQASKKEALNQKQGGLIELINQVILAFDEQGFNGDRPEHSDYFVHEVFDTYVIVRSLPFADTPYPFYKVGWVKEPNSNQIIFDTFDFWIGGNFAFIPGLKNDSSIDEQKQGRVLSQSNFDKLDQAIALLSDVLEGATSDTSEQLSDNTKLENNDYDIIESNSENLALDKLAKSGENSLTDTNKQTLLDELDAIINTNRGQTNG